jgi:SAM-dependent methyltransferase
LANSRRRDEPFTRPSAEKYDRLAEGFSEREYADPVAYAARCARVICACSPRLSPGGHVLDLACGDGLMAAALVARGLRYTGVDASARMVEASRVRHPALTFTAARIEEFDPPEPVDTTICLRAFYYPEERLRFFSRVATYTMGTFVFDLRPGFCDPGPVVHDLRAAGFSSVALRPFFMPQMRHVPSVASPLLTGLEASGPLARLLVRRVGRFFCVAHA